MGMRLLPFSCWHKFQLEHWNSPVLTGGATLWDLWVAAKICRTKYPHRPRLKAKRSAWWHLFWWLRYGWRFRVEREMGRFYDFLQEYNAPPKMWTGKGSTYQKLAEALRRLAEVTTDEAERAEAIELAKKNESFAMGNGPERDIDDGLEQVALFCKRGHPPERAWNMPLGELVWLNVAMAKTEGAKLNLWTPMDEARMKQQLKKRSKKIAEMAKEIEAGEGKNAAEALAYAGVRYWQDAVDRIVNLEAKKS